MLQEINRPTTDVWGTSTELLDSSIMVFKSLNSAYLQLHDVASANNDPHLSDFLEGMFVHFKMFRS